MSDENLDQEQKPAAVHGLTETPFGGNVGRGAEGQQPEANDESAMGAEVIEPDSEPAEPPVENDASEQERAEAETEAEPTMSSAMADYSESFKGLTVGDVVEGTVVHIDREGVLVDVGTKSEGIIRPGELTRDQSLEPEEVVSVGEKIKVYVVEPEGHDGGPVLSKKRADFENAWDRVEKAYADGGVLKAMVTDRVKGGLVVDLGIRGFVPGSHVGSGTVKNLDKYVGQSMAFKVIEVDRERRKVVLSNKLALEEERAAQRKETIATLKEGQIRSGIVRRITDYGAFVDLGGVDGLLHVSEMSWTRINHPSEAVKVGQKIQVMVLKLNLEQGRVSLGLRQILPDPWEDVKRIHSVGSVVEGTVTRLVPFGAFVQVEGGVEGIIPNSELAAKRVNNPEEVVSVGQKVEVKIIDLRPEERRLTLSLRQLHADQERTREETEYRAFAQSKAEDRTTIGDLIGGKLADFAMPEPVPEKTPRRRTKGKSRKRDFDEEAEAFEDVEELVLEEEPEPEPGEASLEVETDAAVAGHETETAQEAADVPEETRVTEEQTGEPAVQDSDGSEPKKPRRKSTKKE